MENQNIELLKDLDLDNSETDQEEGKNRMRDINKAIEEFMNSVHEFQSTYIKYMTEWHPKRSQPQESDDYDDGQTSRRVVNLSSVSFYPKKINTGTRRSILSTKNMLKRRLRRPNKFNGTTYSSSSSSNSGEHDFGEKNVPVRAREIASPPLVGMWESSTLSSSSALPSALPSSSTSLFGGTHISSSSTDDVDMFLLSPMEMNGKIKIQSDTNSRF